MMIPFTLAGHTFGCALDFTHRTYRCGSAVTIWADFFATIGSYDVLYAGMSDKATIIKSSTGYESIIYSVNQEDMVFAMTVIKPVSVCNIRGFQTEHPKLIIVPKANMMTPFKLKYIIPSNIDMFAYINSKFVYTERHIRKQMESLYTHIMDHKCELEREVLFTQLSIATYAPQEFAYLRMKEPGYTANVMGELINIM